MYVDEQGEPSHADGLGSREITQQACAPKHNQPKKEKTSSPQMASAKV